MNELKNSDNNPIPEPAYSMPREIAYMCMGAALTGFIWLSSFMFSSGEYVEPNVSAERIAAYRDSPCMSSWLEARLSGGSSKEGPITESEFGRAYDQCKQAAEDRKAFAKQVFALTEVDLSRAVIFYPSAPGCTIDLPDEALLPEIASTVFDQKRVVPLARGSRLSAVCLIVHPVKGDKAVKNASSLTFKSWVAGCEKPKRAISLGIVTQGAVLTRECFEVEGAASAGPAKMPERVKAVDLWPSAPGCVIWEKGANRPMTFDDKVGFSQLNGPLTATGDAVEYTPQCLGRPRPGFEP